MNRLFSCVLFFSAVAFARASLIDEVIANVSEQINGDIQAIGEHVQEDIQTILGHVQEDAKAAGRMEIANTIQTIGQHISEDVQNIGGHLQGDIEAVGAHIEQAIQQFNQSQASVMNGSSTPSAATGEASSAAPSV